MSENVAHKGSRSPWFWRGCGLVMMGLALLAKGQFAWLPDWQAGAACGFGGALLAFAHRLARP